MKWCSKSCILCVVILFVVASVLCHIIALATNYWLRSDNKDVTNFMNIGLWVACFYNYVHPHEKPQHLYDGCHSITSEEYARIQDWLQPSWLVVCKILAIIGLILQIVGIILVIILILWFLCKCFLCDGKRDCCERCLIYAAPIIWILAGMFIMMAVMIFADMAFRLQCKDFWVGGGDPNTNHLSWSWGFEVAACILSFFTGGFLIWMVVLWSRDEDY